MPNSATVDQNTNDTTPATQSPNASVATPANPAQTVPPNVDLKSTSGEQTGQATSPTDGKSGEQGQEGDNDASKQIDSLLDDNGEKKEGEGEPKEGDDKKEVEKPSQLGAPEDGYKFEGMNPAEPAVQAFSQAAKELDLSQDSANLLMAKSLDGIKSQMAHQRNELVKQCMQDEALGLRDATSRRQIQQTYARYFGDKPELRAKIKSLNLDVDPQFLSVMKKISSEMSEGSFVNGQRGGESADDDFRKLYPNTRMNR